MPLITEHSITLNITPPKGDVDMKMPIFYNPVMTSNRNISILLINTITTKSLNIADPLAGSGIRSLRFLKELKANKIKHLYVNDLKEQFPRDFQNSFLQNNINNIIINSEKLTLSSQDANQFLLSKIGFDYIEIDPFGSPNNFLAAAVSRISRGGIIALTATDTAALTGTYPKVTLRKYWAKSIKCSLMHEIGLRILIRKIQLQGIQFDKALLPILSYHKDHYFRVYLQSTKRKDACDHIIRQHQFLLYCPHCLSSKLSKFNKEQCSCSKQFDYAGPLWIGPLANTTLLAKMIKNNPFDEEKKFLELLGQEYTLKEPFFYDLHEISRKLHKQPPRTEDALKTLKGARTHFTPTGIKTQEGIEVIKKLF